MDEIRNVALLGTGIMGYPMARNLVRAGFQVTVWNRSREKAAPLTEEGARLAETAEEAVADAQVVITMLENGPVVTEVLLVRNLARHAPANTLFIDMSSIPPSLARDHAAQLEEAGQRYIDAPVSGGQGGAEDATLAIMVGGAPADFEQAGPLFSAMGRGRHVGPVGCGQLTKLANQAIVGITIGAVSEALLLVKAGGGDPEAAREAISGGFADSRILQVHGERMLKHDFQPGGTVAIQLKDLDNILEAARDAGLKLPFTECARAGFAELAAKPETAKLDHSALLLWLEAMNEPHSLKP
ncbi:NAD(P)-dependent oxidoreductase [Fodinicurvata halophila]|uniref:NAD(P)-dependent oxidoreductase n=2 Tax=Fodinicurvata halophila TaxID=1419723 RepID=A0ABV8UH02_9PROT